MGKTTQAWKGQGQGAEWGRRPKPAEAQAAELGRRWGRRSKRRKDKDREPSGEDDPSLRKDKEPSGEDDGEDDPSLRKDKEPNGEDDGEDDPSLRKDRKRRVGKMIQAWEGQGAEHGTRVQKWDRRIINALYYRYHKLHLTKTFCRKRLRLIVPCISSYR